MNYDEALDKSVAGFPRTIQLTDYDIRVKAAQQLVECTKGFGFAEYVTDKKWASEVEEDGITNIGQMLNVNQIEEIKKYFYDKKVFSGHIVADSTGKGYDMHSIYTFKYGSYLNQDTISAPYFLDLALNNDLVATAEAYLGCTPTIFSMNCWWTLPNNMSSGIEDYHRDWDDYKFMAAFIYLTDVDEESGGEHCFIRKFHTPEINKRFGRNVFEEKSTPQWYDENCPDLVSYFRAKAGTCFCADTFSLHRAMQCKKPRLALWIRYGYFANHVFLTDKGRQENMLPGSTMAKVDRTFTDKERYMTRLIIGD